MTDIYAVRDTDNAIIALYAYPVDGSSAVADDDQEVVTFRRYRTSSLAGIVAILAARVDADAEAARLAFVTAGAAQMEAYRQKEAEALAVLALADPSSADPATFPMLATGLGIDGGTMQDVAAVVVATASAWRGVNAVIEGLRRAAKAAIASATNIAEAEAAASVTWPNPGA